MALVGGVPLEGQEDVFPPRPGVPRGLEQVLRGGRGALDDDAPAAQHGRREGREHRQRGQAQAKRLAANLFGLGAIDDDDVALRLGLFQRAGGGVEAGEPGRIVCDLSAVGQLLDQGGPASHTGLLSVCWPSAEGRGGKNDGRASDLNHIDSHF